MAFRTFAGATAVRFDLVFGCLQRAHKDASGCITV